MTHSFSKNKPTRYLRLSPWLNLLGAALVVVMTALFSAIHSPLGQEISAGESPGFNWIRANIIAVIGFGLGYLIVTRWLQIRHLRQSNHAARMLSLLICTDIAGIALIALLLFSQQTNFLPPVLTAVLVSMLLQTLLNLWPSAKAEADRISVVSQTYSTRTGLFLVLLFVAGAAISLLDPSWRRLSDQVYLDSDWQYTLRGLYPPVLSGVTNLWFGIGMVAIILGCRRMQFKLRNRKGVYRTFNFLTFFFLLATSAAFLLTTLYYAIPWQINNLDLKYTVWQLYLLFSIGGGILFSAVFARIVTRIPGSEKGSMIGIIALVVGATLLFPITLFLMSWRRAHFTWVLLSISTFCGFVFVAYLALFGDFFNPWFTTFSYLKGAILSAVSMVVAGIGVLIIEQFLSPIPESPSIGWSGAISLAIVGTLGFIPFYTLGQNYEVKTAVLQYNELARVNTTFAREFTRALGIGKWFRIGQRPVKNGASHPWPLPWRLAKTHPSLLPDNFNLLVIVADALRGDAFHSAGYHRNLTPFMDQWARKEAVSFRQAYSQGGGSFAAYPFLVAGRSRFDLYGPGLYQRNLYFIIARAEGIQNYMMMKGFGPRDIYPPALQVIELEIPRAVSDRRSATADEVFESARKAISALPADERFLCFVTLMDVHNDLWKKEEGIDFGDRPRDVYDNNLSYMDRALNRFISWLKQTGIYDRTVVVFTSDHGEQFWEHGASLHGHTVYEEDIRIPLILVSHSIRKRIEDVPVIAADMAPTIADLAGYSIEPPYEDPHMGISLVPLIRGNEKMRYLKRDIVGRASFKPRYFLYRNWEWKLIFLAELDLLQLFNVKTDPDEKTNLLEEKPTLARELEQELLEYLKAVEGRAYRSIFFKK